MSGGFGSGILIGQKGVKYGLTVRGAPGAQKKPVQPKKPVFGEDESDEEEANVEQQIARQAARKQTDKKVRRASRAQ